MSFWKLFGLTPNKKQNTSVSSQRTAPAKPVRTPADAPNFDPIRIEEPASGAGFDPYNTGSFDKRHTWERTNRR